MKTRSYLISLFAISIFILDESSFIDIKTSHLYSQQNERPLILQKGDSWLEIKPGQKVYIRSYKKTLFRNRILTDIPQRKIIPSGPKVKPSTFISIDHQQKVLITQNDAIALSDFYSISPVTDGTMALKAAKNGFVGGFFGGFAASFLLLLSDGEVDIANEFLQVILLSSFLGVVTAVTGGIQGLLVGSFFPDITEEFIISPDEWSIIEQ
ncbi:hypothetical protein OAA83_00120 [Candidatus Marinimicrobia bacterium]|nr:hypothetical protein [Candidatus Neomarinimicrobiota bacterium]